MLISDAYSWSPNNILEVVVIPYYGYICSDDDDPNHYVFNPHPYGVVDLDAYFVNIDNFSDSYLVCFCDEGRIGNNSFDSSRNYGIFGVVYGEQDAYFIYEEWFEGGKIIYRTDSYSKSVSLGGTSHGWNPAGVVK